MSLPAEARQDVSEQPQEEQMALEFHPPTLPASLQGRAEKRGVVETPNALVIPPILCSQFDDDAGPGFLHAGLRTALRLSHGRKT